MGWEFAYHYDDDAMVRFVAHLDFQLLCGGHAEDKDDLERLHPFRSDPFFRVYRPMSGSLRVRDCDNITQINTGSYWLLPAAVPFRMLTDGGGFTHEWFHFKSIALERHPGFRHIVSVPSTPQMDDAWRRFMKEVIADARSFENVYESHLLGRQIIFPFMQKIESESGRNPGEAQTQFGDVLQYVGDSYMNPIQIPDLAAMAGMPHNKFSSLFRKAFGISPKEYVVNVRIAHAKILLLTTEMTGSQIAFKCGFNDIYFFFRCFRKRCGMTPGKYREIMNLGN